MTATFSLCNVKDVVDSACALIALHGVMNAKGADDGAAIPDGVFDQEQVERGTGGLPWPLRWLSRRRGRVERSGSTATHGTGS